MARFVGTMVKRETTSKKTRTRCRLGFMNLAKLAELQKLNIQYMRSICSLYYTSSLSE